MSDTATIESPRTRIATRVVPKREVKRPTLWHVVLHDDADHTYQYVMEMLQRLFAKALDESFLMAQIVDSRGQVICETCHKERAEFKRDQILGYGTDMLIARCKGSMTATIEPACSDDDGDDHHSSSD